MPITFQFMSVNASILYTPVPKETHTSQHKYRIAFTLRYVAYQLDNYRPPAANTRE